jgi:hypothetical protein
MPLVIRMRWIVRMCTQVSYEDTPDISQPLRVWETDIQRCSFDRGIAVEYYTHCWRKVHAGKSLQEGKG